MFEGTFALFAQAKFDFGPAEVGYVFVVCGLVMMSLLMGHIYMGTIGTKGAYGAMKTGYVDEAWAQEHHELWYDDVKAGKIPAQRSQSAGPSVGDATAKA